MMKPELTGLKRIETTLEQIRQKSTATAAVESISPESYPSFDIGSHRQKTEPTTVKMPALPKLESGAIATHPQKIDPALALDILQEIAEIVTHWQQELKQVLEQIQALYDEGPLIDGWLESHASNAAPNFAAPSKAKLDGLMDYIEALGDDRVSYQTPRTGYRLCGLNEVGQVWSQDCPSEQVADVSLAIARYQKLQQLLVSKQNLETRLEGLTETLMMMRHSLDRV